jgi:hypothetical protein
MICDINIPNKLHACSLQHPFLLIQVLSCYHLFPPKAIPHSFSKPLNSLVHILRRSRRIRRPKEQSRRCLFLLGQEPRSSGDEDAVLDTGVENLLFDIQDASLSCLGMLCMVDIYPHLAH